jgi:zinc transporter, ZIP family
MNLNTVLSAALLSLIAGMGTGLGGWLAVVRKPGRRSFGFLMGVTAGVMISLSFLSLVNEAWKMQGYLTATIGFALGALLMFGFDVLLPHIHFGEMEAGSSGGSALPVIVPESDCETSRGEFQAPPGNDRVGLFGRKRRRRGNGHSASINPVMMQSGVLLAIGITIHNLPEGFAVGAGYAHLPSFGVMIALAILLHNIPEGIATALPLCQAGMSRGKAFRVALLSGFAEPVGALAAATFLSGFQSLIPGSLAFAGGVMMFITLDELIPIAREHGHQHYTALGIILGSIFVFLLSGILGI